MENDMTIDGINYINCGRTFENLQEAPFSNLDNGLSQRNKETIMSTIAMKPSNTKEFIEIHMVSSFAHSKARTNCEYNDLLETKISKIPMPESCKIKIVN